LWRVGFFLRGFEVEAVGFRRGLKTPLVEERVLCERGFW